MNTHKISQMFPPMSEGVFESLKQSIKDNGLRDPIILFQNAILDGVHRHKACTQLKVKPRFTQFQGTEIEAKEYAFEVNFFRRHLTDAQRACCAAEFMQETKLTQAERATKACDIRWHGAKNDNIVNGKRVKLISIVSKKYKIGEGRLKVAITLFLNDKELFKRAKDGKIGMNAAYTEYRNKAGSKCRSGKWVRESTDINLEKSLDIKVPDEFKSEDEFKAFMRSMILNGWVGEMKTVILMSSTGEKNVGYQFNWYGNGYAPRRTTWGGFNAEDSLYKSIILASKERIKVVGERVIKNSELMAA